jgi:hypothetical protein
MQPWAERQNGQCNPAQRDRHKSYLLLERGRFLPKYHSEEGSQHRSKDMDQHHALTL